MATYIYETIPQQPDEVPTRFEVSQRMVDPPLTVHPETQQPVRRIVVGGFRPIGVSAPAVANACSHGGGGGCCG